MAARLLVGAARTGKELKGPGSHGEEGEVGVVVVSLMKFEGLRVYRFIRW